MWVEYQGSRYFLVTFFIFSIPALGILLEYSYRHSHRIVFLKEQAVFSPHQYSLAVFAASFSPSIVT
jgi:hypothetical protein